MTESVYIESSIISYLTAKPSRDIIVAARQSLTKTWWQVQRHKFELYVSVLVKKEITKGDIGAAKKRLKIIENIPIIAITADAETLTEEVQTNK